MKLCDGILLKAPDSKPGRWRISDAELRLAEAVLAEARCLARGVELKVVQGAEVALRAARLEAGRVNATTLGTAEAGPADKEAGRKDRRKERRKARRANKRKLDGS